MSLVHVIVPAGIDDPARPSGGNAYDRRICSGLAVAGWTVREHAVAGSWPRPDAASLAALAGVVEPLPDDAVVLVDGLIASAAPEVLVPQAARMRLVVLVHMAFGDPAADDAPEDAPERERAVLASAAAVVTTSAFTRRRLLELYPLAADRVHVALPGVDGAALATGTADGGALLCVAAVIARKGQDLLLDALATMPELPWRCVCVGNVDRDSAFAARLGRRAAAAGLGDRFVLTGPRTGAALDTAYAEADLLVMASRAEPYGMVVTEALAHGLPVVAAEVGGLPEALGHASGGARPGLLVPPGDATALAAALRAWLGDDGLRGRLRRAARDRRASLAGWSVTTDALAGVLAGAAR